MAIYITEHRLLSKDEPYQPVEEEVITFYTIPERIAKVTPKDAFYKNRLRRQHVKMEVYVQYVNSTWGPGITRVQGYTVEPDGSKSHVIVHYRPRDEMQHPIVGTLQLQAHG